MAAQATSNACLPLGFFDRFAFGLRNHILQVRHAFALERTGDAGARYVGVDVLPRNEKQIVEWQIKRLAQCKNDGFLGTAQCRVERMGTVGTVLHIIAFEPLFRGRPRACQIFGVVRACG